MAVIGQGGKFCIVKKNIIMAYCCHRLICTLAPYLSNMTSHTGNDSWKEDQTLKETFKRYVNEQL